MTTKTDFLTESELALAEAHLRIGTLHLMRAGVGLGAVSTTKQFEHSKKLCERANKKVIAILRANTQKKKK